MRWICSSFRKELWLAANVRFPEAGWYRYLLSYARVHVHLDWPYLASNVVIVFFDLGKGRMDRCCINAVDEEQNRRTTRCGSYVRIIIYHGAGVKSCERLVNTSHSDISENGLTEDGMASLSLNGWLED